MNELPEISSDNKLTEIEEAKQDVLKILTENLESLELIRLAHESMVLKHECEQKQRNKIIRELIPLFIASFILGVSVGFSLRGLI